MEAVLKVRGKKSFSSVADLCERADLREVGKRALESLIKVGALDSLAPRLNLLELLDRLMNFSGSLHRAAEVGQMSFFGDTTGVEFSTELAGVLVSELSQEVSPREMLQWERELVGVYISEHPLQRLIDRIKHVVTAYSSEITEADHDRQVAMAGMVTYVRPHVTKNGKPMAFAGLEDLYGQLEVVIWPSTWEETRELWEPDRILLVRGKLDASRGDPKLLCEEATTNFDLFEARADDPDIQKSWTAVMPAVYDDEPPPPDLVDSLREMGDFVAAGPHPVDSVELGRA